jgi:hypothetical protein
MPIALKIMLGTIFEKGSLKLKTGAIDEIKAVHPFFGITMQIFENLKLIKNYCKKEKIDFYRLNAGTKQKALSTLTSLSAIAEEVINTQKEAEKEYKRLLSRARSAFLPVIHNKKFINC